MGFDIYKLIKGLRKKQWAGELYRAAGFYHQTSAGALCAVTIILTIRIRGIPVGGYNKVNKTFGQGEVRLGMNSPFGRSTSRLPENYLYRTIDAYFNLSVGPVGIQEPTF